ncbi:hypothetical protein B0O99DRAFT_643268 [Bisporella sp. PMI_857]|nr:hypothetical protein B0O99DRAFT_643268 [Bisporella sp. PMI_857]
MARDSSSVVYILFMSEIGTAPGSYKLVRACQLYGLFFLFRLGAREEDSYVSSLDMSALDIDMESQRLRPFIPSFDLSQTLYNELQSILKMLGDLDRPFLEKYRGWGGVGQDLMSFCGDKDWTPRDILPVFQALLDEDSGLKTANFVHSYCQGHLFKWCQDNNPRVKDGFFSMSIRHQDWDWSRYHYWSWLEDLQWKPETRTLRTPIKIWQKIDRERGRAISDMIENYLLVPTARIRVRISMEALKSTLCENEIYQALKSLRRARRLTGEEEVAMIIRGPQKTDRFLCLYDWPQALVDDFQAGNTIRKVNII